MQERKWRDRVYMPQGALQRRCGKGYANGNRFANDLCRLSVITI
jgi:hypothetical protein